MVEARKVAGITNTSTYTNMRSANDYYANLIKVNDENRLIVVVGSNTNGYQPNSQWQEILSGHHYKYYLTKKAEVAWTDKMSGTYNEAFNVRLIAVSENNNAQLVYTLDGSEPTASSTKADNGTTLPFSEEGTYTLKVGLLVDGSVKSVITRSYTINHPEQFAIPACCTMDENEVCAFFEAPVNWTSTVACWAWCDTPSENFTFSQRSGWPGVDCVKIGKADNGNDVWKWSWDGKKEKNSSATQPAKIIFSNAGSPQTADLPFQNGGYYDKDGLKGVVSSTGIKSIDNEQRIMDHSWYTIDGRRLSGKPTKKGVYIYNGRKAIVR